MKFGIWVLFEVTITILENAAVVQHNAVYLQLQQQILSKISFFVKMPKDGKYSFEMTQLFLKTVCDNSCIKKTGCSCMLQHMCSKVAILQHT